MVENTGYGKGSIRANIDHKFNDWLSLDLSTNYINSKAGRGFFNNGNTNTTVGYALAFTGPWENLFADAAGVYPAGGAGSNVVETVNTITNDELVNRFLGSARLQANLFVRDNQSLKFIGLVGGDQYNLQTTGIFPGTLSFFRAAGTLGGASIQGNTRNTIGRLAGFLVQEY